VTSYGRREIRTRADDGVLAGFQLDLALVERAERANPLNLNLGGIIRQISIRTGTSKPGSRICSRWIWDLRTGPDGSCRPRA